MVDLTRRHVTKKQGSLHHAGVSAGHYACHDLGRLGLTPHWSLLAGLPRFLMARGGLARQVLPWRFLISSSSSTRNACGKVNPTSPRRCCSCRRLNPQGRDAQFAQSLRAGCYLISHGPHTDARRDCISASRRSEDASGSAGLGRATSGPGQTEPLGGGCPFGWLRSRSWVPRLLARRHTSRLTELRCAQHSAYRCSHGPCAAASRQEQRPRACRFVLRPF